LHVSYNVTNAKYQNKLEGKSISIDYNLEEKEPNYKKMSANKLKSIAVEKGLIKASSKLTKQEMLKLFHF
jgi:hypothetical protein